MHRGCRAHRRAKVEPVLMSNSSVVFSVDGGCGARSMSVMRTPSRTAAMTRSTWLSASAAVASTVDRVIAAVRDGVRITDIDRAPHPPSTLNTTLEFDISTGSTLARRWARHPRCTQCSGRRG